ncbi:hypothetical protein WJX74_005567 [Apatococcus lobatus]|uniref:Uncharacterized protein n=2 Tax=Apatococcus TaxID=904362 RepID=A0AAW1QZX0_9CHLO
MATCGLFALPARPRLQASRQAQKLQALQQAGFPLQQTIAATPAHGSSLQPLRRQSSHTSPVVAQAAAADQQTSSTSLGKRDENSDPPPISEQARRNLVKAANACRRYGWLSFWSQLILSVVSACILLFSVAFTAQNGPGISLYCTLFGVIAGFLSTFWAFGYTRLSRRMRGLLVAGPSANLQRLRKADVLLTLERGSWINVAGIASTLLGLQATVGLLVAKTLTNATANPFLSGGAGSYNPVLALDVFLVQASTNTLLAHFVSLLCSLWLVRVVGRNSAAASPGKGLFPRPA